MNGVIANRLDSLFTQFGITRESYSEFNSWKSSLPRMGLIIADNRISDDVQVALEYQIPLTSKRVDFMVAGSDGTRDNIVIVELKQWENCTATSRENVVIAFTGGANREVVHPSQQAYSYARLIEHFNESVRDTANAFVFDLDYDIRVYDTASEMRNELRKYNGNNKSRMIAGYCYRWVSKNNKSLNDIILEDGFEAQWNFDTNTFATGSTSFEQVGCIHSTQGLEFDYVGVIIGKDMRFENNRVITDYRQRDSHDKTIQGVKTGADKVLADRIIRNTYKTLLSRGQKGCFIYCQDSSLRDYIKHRLDIIKSNQYSLEAL